MNGVPLTLLLLAGAGLTRVPGVKVGHFTLAERPTGCTVVLTEGGAVAGVDVRGGAPGTREIDLLSPYRDGRKGACDRAFGRERFRPRCRHRRGALSRRERNRLRRRRREGSDRARRDPLRPRGRWEAGRAAGSGVRLQRGESGERRHGLRGQRRRGRGRDGRKARRTRTVDEGRNWKRCNRASERPRRRGPRRGERRRRRRRSRDRGDCRGRANGGRTGLLRRPKAPASRGRLPAEGLARTPPSASSRRTRG